MRLQNTSYGSPRSSPAVAIGLIGAIASGVPRAADLRGSDRHMDLFSVPSPGVTNTIEVGVDIRAVCQVPFGTITNDPGSAKDVI